jgi:hypothetical protein
MLNSSILFTGRTTRYGHVRRPGRSSLAPGPRRARLSSDPLPRGGRCDGPAPPTSQAVGALCAPGRGAPPSAPGPSGTAARRRHRRASFRCRRRRRPRPGMRRRYRRLGDAGRARPRLGPSAARATPRRAPSAVYSNCRSQHGRHGERMRAEGSGGCTAPRGRRGDRSAPPAAAISSLLPRQRPLCETRFINVLCIKLINQVEPTTTQVEATSQDESARPCHD